LSCVAAQPRSSWPFSAEWDSWLRLTAAATVVDTSLTSQRGPYIAPAWTAEVLGDYGKAFGQGQGTLYRDAAGQRWRMKSCSHQKLFRPDGRACFDQLSVNLTGPGSSYGMNTTIGEESDAVCKAIPSPYSDLFAPLALTEHVGTGHVGGRPCELWLLSAPAGNLSACVAHGLPLQWSSNAMGRTQTLTFLNFTLGRPSSEVFEPSVACTQKWPMPPCHNASVQELLLYRVRSAKEPNTLADRNVGDALGDMAFFCDLAGFDTSNVVTSWSVHANSSWGQYGYCLFVGGKNKCYGSTAKQVGRESALGLGKGEVQGQCSANEDVGSWYSIPSDGRCAPGTAVGTDGCTWTAKLLRTVSSACIFNERGLKATCELERGHAPMLRSAAIFRAAMESADASKGGCPDVGGEDVLIVV